MKDHTVDSASALAKALQFEAVMGMLGWSVVCKYAGETFLIARALKTPDGFLRRCEKDRLLIAKKIIEASAQTA